MYDENGNVIRQDETDLGKQARWYHTVLTIPVSDIPEFEEEEEYEILGILKPSIVKTKISKAKINGVQHEVDFGCLFAATYFYTLVSNTPIDEVYTKQSNASEDSPATQGEKVNYWERARIAIKNRDNHTKGDSNKSIGEIEQELREKGTKIVSTRYVTHTHHPDEEYVRGDWVMTFRGVTFKAFASKPNKNSEAFSPQVVFNEEDFKNPITQSDTDALNKDYYDEKGRIRNTAFKPYIWNLAEKIASVVETGIDDISVEVHNINPRWQILEYGGYTSDSNGPWKGKGKYGLPHGVTDKGFSFQAPMGFKRIVDAQYNAIMTRSALYNKSKNGINYGNASAYTRGNRNLDWNFDITKMDQQQYNKLMSLFQNEDKTLELPSIHTIDGTKIWKWEPIK